MIKIKAVQIYTCAFVLAMVLVSCSSKKSDNPADAKGDSTSVSAQQIDDTPTQQILKPSEQKEGRTIIGGKDITDNKQSCTSCNGTGKKGGKKCDRCKGYGYILTF